MGSVTTKAFARWIIMGAAGRDFHNFHTTVRDHERGAYTKVVAFTATQIPGIESRRYPRSLAGVQYPQGIPILPESELMEIIKREGVTHAVFSYSDVSYEYIGKKSAMVNAAGAHFMLPGTEETMIPSSKPVIAVCAVRTGCGKSQTSRMLIEHLIKEGISTVAVRHPMAYGNLETQRVQRFASYEDMRRHDCTIEEMEEFEPFIDKRMVVFCGVDFGDILVEAEKEASVVLWDGGNNDTPFYKPDLHITVVDPLRPGHEVSYYPGLVNLTMAHVIVVNKMNSAKDADVGIVLENIKRHNPQAQVVFTNSVVSIDDPQRVSGRKVLVIEDGPTVTHGGMPYGAGRVAAKQYGAAEIVDPTSYLVGSLVNTFEKHPHLKRSGTLPAMGYGEQQIDDLAATINAVPCDVVVSGTPIDLARVLGNRTAKEIVRVSYESEQIQGPWLGNVVEEAIVEAGKRKANLKEV